MNEALVFFFKKVKCKVIIQYFWNLLHLCKTKFMFFSQYIYEFFILPAICLPPIVSADGCEKASRRFISAL